MDVAPTRRQGRAASVGAIALIFVAGCGGGERPTRTAVEVADGTTTATDPAATTDGATTAADAAPSPATDPGHETARVTLPGVMPPGSVRVPVLMYHRIADPAPIKTQLERSLNVPPADFAAQMRWLDANGFTTITQSQLFAAMAHDAPLPKKPVLVTFDDGYIDIAKTAMPILRRRGMVATAYVITSRVTGPDRAFMKFKALRRIEAAGIEVGSHSETHADLTAISDASVMQELDGSRRTLERGLGHPVQWLCYPAGRFNANVEALARRAGYVLAVTTEPGSVHDRSRPFAVSRVRVSNTTGVAGLRDALT